MVFGRARFPRTVRSFVALAIDGDSPGAQQLAEQFKLRSYPTLVVLRPDGAEVTRLPCELDGKRFVHILELALNARFTVAESLSVALSRERKLSDDEWRLLSFYSWDTDERQLLKNLDFAAIVASLTRACTLADASVRLEWLGLHAAAMAGETGIDQAAAIGRLDTTLADPHAVCLQLDIVIGYALDLVRFLTAPASAARQRLIALWSHALEGLENDDTLNISDRLGALRTRVRLTRLGAPDPQLVALRAPRGWPTRPRCRCRRRCATRSSTPAPACWPTPAWWSRRSSCCRPSWRTSHAPFYFMHNLAAIAKRRGEPAAALDWYEQAWHGAAGPRHAAAMGRHLPAGAARPGAARRAAHRALRAGAAGRVRRDAGRLLPAQPHPGGAHRQGAVGPRRAGGAQHCCGAAGLQSRAASRPPRHTFHVLATGRDRLRAQRCARLRGRRHWREIRIIREPVPNPALQRYLGGDDAQARIPQRHYRVKNSNRCVRCWKRRAARRGRASTTSTTCSARCCISSTAARAWRSLPPVFPPWRTVHEYFTQWTLARGDEHGLLERALGTAIGAQRRAALIEQSCDKRDRPSEHTERGRPA